MRKSASIVFGYHLIVGALVFLPGCAKTPRTHTAAPSLTGAADANRRIYNDVTSAKGGIVRALTIGEEIDFKIMRLKGR